MKRTLFENVAVLCVSGDSVIDRFGYLSVIISMITASELSEVSVSVTHSDEPDGTFEEVQDDRLIPVDTASVNISPSIADGGGFNYNVSVDLLGCKRYIKVAVTVDGESTDEPYGLVLGDPAEMPVGQ